MALVLNESCTAKTLSCLSKVTRQDIYRIMPKLQTLGLAQKILSIPTEWEAAPIDEGLTILLERKNKQFSELQEKTTKLLDNLREISKRTENREKGSESSQKGMEEGRLQPLFDFPRREELSAVLGKGGRKDLLAEANEITAGQVRLALRV